MITRQCHTMIPGPCVRSVSKYQWSENVSGYMSTCHSSCLPWSCMATTLSSHTSPDHPSVAGFKFITHSPGVENKTDAGGWGSKCIRWSVLILSSCPEPFTQRCLPGLVRIWGAGIIMLGQLLSSTPMHYCQNASTFSLIIKCKNWKFSEYFIIWSRGIIIKSE